MMGLIVVVIGVKIEGEEEILDMEAGLARKEKTFQKSFPTQHQVKVVLCIL